MLAESPAALEVFATLWGIAEKTGFTPQERNIEALRQFAAKLTRNRGVISEADVSAFKAAGYDNRAMLDVLVLAAT